MSELKTAIVTGAARGIGLSITRRFLDAGYRVAMLDIDNTNLQSAAATIEFPDAILPVHTDVSERESVAQAITRPYR